MIEEKIKKFAESRNIAIRQLVLDIGMTESGYYSMIRNNSIKLETLRKISHVLKIPLKYFVEDESPLPDDLPTVVEQKAVEAIVRTTGKVDDATLRLIERLENDLRKAEEREEWLKRQNEALMEK